MSEPHVHVVTACKACSALRAAQGKPSQIDSAIPVEGGIPGVPATYTFRAEWAHELKDHKEIIADRIRSKFPKEKPYYAPMKSRIIEFRHGSEHNGK